MARTGHTVNPMNSQSLKRTKIEARVAFLQTRTDELGHYLPETYQMLIEEMDRQQRDQIALKIQELYSL